MLGLLLAVTLFFGGGCAKNVPTEDILTVKRPPLEGVTHDGLLINEGLTEKVLLTAYSQLGTPYRYGGTTPNRGFDCSGFTSWVYSQNGIQLPRSSKEQFQVGRPVAQEDLKPGDLLMYKRGRGSGTHIGIYVGDGRYIHSPSRGKTVMEANAFNPRSNLRFLGARRVFEDPASCPLTPEQKENARHTFNPSEKNDIKVVFKPGKKPKLLSENLQTFHIGDLKVH
ncbi:MAG: C40 family peptidase [Desulfovibrionaceae bacterium]|nr:C40 family peptidase [Desulfovibrionaceae bacterium]